MAEEETIEISAENGGKMEILKNKKVLMALVVVVIVVIAAFAVAYVSVSGIKTVPKEHPGGGGNETKKIELIPAFTWSDANGDNIISVNESVTFDASQSSPDYAHISWDFGDGANDSTNKTRITHTYTKVGTYTVTLTLTLGSNKNSTSEYISVAKEAAPDITMTIQPGSTTTNLLCRILFTVRTNNTNQLFLSNYQFLVYNGSGEELGEIKFRDVLSNLTPPTHQTPITWATGVNYTDGPDSTGLISQDDTLLIAGDGGYGIQSGDTCVLVYLPMNMEVCTAVIPEQLP